MIPYLTAWFVLSCFAAAVMVRALPPDLADHAGDNDAEWLRLLRSEMAAGSVHFGGITK